MPEKRNILTRKEQLESRRDKLSAKHQNLLQKRLEGQSKIETIARRPDRMLAPLSFDQQRLWFLSQFAPESFLYNVPIAFRLRGILHYPALVQSIAQIIQRHEILRTAFQVIDEQPMQLIKQDSNWHLQIVDLSRLPVAEREPHLRYITERESKRPFDLQSLPLLRTILLKLTDHEHFFILNIHHIITDALSMDIFLQEFAAFYSSARISQPATLPDLPIQYGDYAYWQRQWLKSEKLEKQLHYWKQSLKNAPSLLQFPTDKPRPPVQSLEGATCSRSLSPDLTKALYRIIQGKEITVFMLFLAAYQVLLYRYTQQNEIVTGFPVANRNRSELKNLIGFFVNTLVVCTDFSGSPTFRHILEQVRQKTLDAYENWDVPFERIVEVTQSARDVSHMPLVQTMISVQHISLADKIVLPDLQAEFLDISEGIIKFDLSLFINETSDGLEIEMVYNTCLFEEETVERLITHLEILLKCISQNFDIAVNTIPLLTKDEQKLLLTDWSQSLRTDITQKLYVHQQVAEQAHDRLAISDGKVYVTYNTLNERANQLAHYLQALGVGPNVLVAVCLDRVPDLIVHLLAILRAGGGYIPLDPTYPIQRLAFMIADAKAKVVLTSQRRLANLQQVVTENFEKVSCHFVATDESWPTYAPKWSPRLQLLPDNLAYVIYTSGSTGLPKGVPITHKSLLNLVNWFQREGDISTADRASLVASISFDASVYEIWPYLTRGASLHIPDDETRIDVEVLQNWLIEMDITMAYTPTVIAEQLMGLEWPADISLRLLTMGGDRLHVYPDSTLPFKVGNGYGPTENTVVTTFEIVPVKEVHNRLPTIGRPLDNVQVFILDDHLQPVPVGVPGELYIGGDSLALGYLHRPALTATQFIPNPYSKISDLPSRPGKRLYRSGDLVRFLADGRMEFLGRRDFQVKIRGFRIELGEIEAVFKQHRQLQEVAVIVQESNHHKQLVAYILPVDQTDDLVISELKDFGRQQLPPYMIPDTFIILADLPLTANGKVDRQQLPALKSIVPPTKKNSKPQTMTQIRLADIWATLLNHEQISLDDNFFDLGGHSLLLTQVKSQIRQIFEVELSLQALFQKITIAEQATHIDDLLHSNLSDSLPVSAIPTHEGDFPLSFAQQRLWFLEQLQPGKATYNIAFALKLTGPFDLAIFEQCITHLSARHPTLRTTFPFVDELPVQKVASEQKLVVPLVNLQTIPKQRQDDLAFQLISEEGGRPFDLVHGPLIRIILFQLETNVHILHFTLHHIISDAWSMNILTQELMLLYQAAEQNQAVELPELPIGYADFAIRQRTWLAEGGMIAQLSFWQKHLQDLPAALELPTDYPRSAVQTFNGDTETFTISKQTIDRLKTIAQQEKATLFMALLTAFNILLYRYTNQKDIVIGSPIANRNWPGVEDIIGFFVNVIVLRTKLTNNPHFRELLNQVRETALNAYTHQDLPFEYLVEKIQPNRDMGHTPLFQVMFSLQNMPNATTFSLPGRQIDLLPVETNTAKFDLTLILEEGLTGTMYGVFEYNSDLFQPSTIKRLSEQFQILLAAIVDNPEARIEHLRLLSPTIEQKLIYSWNDTQKIYPQERFVHQWFESQAEKYPERIAVSFGDTRVTYKQLNLKSNQLAHYLQKCGVGPETLVGVCMERSLEMVLALVAIMKAGGAYVPLDPAYPQKRLAFMLSDAQVSVLVTQTQFKETSLPSLSNVIFVDQIEPLLSHESTETLALELTAENAAYMIYTSGSTGKPKGVINTHGAILNRLLWMQDKYQLTEADCVLQKTPFSFDVSVWEFFLPLMVGAHLVIAEPEGHKDTHYLCQLILKQEITIMHFVPSMLQLFLEEPALNRLSSLRLVICSGEALPVELNNRFFEVLDAKLHNLYGPTEAAVDVSYWACHPQNRHQSVPIGCPIANVSLYVLDQHFQPVPVGVVGELYIGGDGLGRGYHRRPGLTADKFVPTPFKITKRENRLYKTGDLARFRPDGNIEFFGRIDHQVKIRGFRIELGEIQALLHQHPAVQEAVVIAEKSDRLLNDQTLAGYIVPVKEAAHTIHKVVQLKEEGLPNGLSWYELPEDDLIIVSLNEKETDFMYQEIFVEEMYLQHGITIRPDDYIFDVGANIGLFSLYVSRKFPQTNVYAFEPIPTVFSALTLNKALYKINARLFKYGLADENGEGSITFYPHNTIISGRFADRAVDRQVVASYIKNRQVGTVLESELEELLSEQMAVQTIPSQFKTVSQVIKEESIKEIGLLKIDVEKSELDVINGIDAEDWKRIRQIVVEVHDIDNRVNHITSLLEAQGFEVVQHQDRLLAGSGLYNLYAKRPSFEASQPTQTSIETRQTWHSPTRLRRDLIQFITEKAPEYMVPATITFLTGMPLTPNGKLDRRKLPSPEHLVSHRHVAPRNHIEHTLADIWKNLLQVERISIYDNFFDLGGHSLLTVRLMSQIRRHFKRSMSLSSFFNNPTIAKMSQELNQESQETFSQIVKLHNLPLEDNSPPLLSVHPADGTIFCYLDLARIIGGKWPFYGIQYRGLDAGQIKPINIPDLANSYIDELLKTDINGPYYLVGWSLGGSIALEIAYQLQKRGESVAVLFLIDSYPIEVLNMPKELDEERLRSDYTNLLAPFLNEGNYYQQTDALFQIYRTNIQALMSYKLPSYTGQVVLIQAEESRTLIPDSLGGWHNLNYEKFKVHLISGSTHFDILRLPHVETVATIVQNYLPT